MSESHQYKEAPPVSAASGGEIHVRETFFQDASGKVHYRADNEFLGQKVRWTPSMHMPRALSRFTIEITNVTIQRIQEITEEEARAEGVAWSDGTDAFGRATLVLPARKEFRHLWDDLYPDHNWIANPWVWVVSFTKVWDIEADFS